MFTIEVSKNMYSNDIKIVVGNTTISYNHLDENQQNDIAKMFLIAASTITKDSIKYDQMCNDVLVESFIGFEDKADYLYINDFCKNMKKEMTLARIKGKYGWNDPSLCEVSYLEHLLAESVQKRNYINAANYCMMLYNRNKED